MIQYLIDFYKENPTLFIFKILNYKKIWINCVLLLQCATAVYFFSPFESCALLLQSAVYFFLPSQSTQNDRCYYSELHAVFLPFRELLFFCLLESFVSQFYGMARTRGGSTETRNGNSITKISSVIQIIMYSSYTFIIEISDMLLHINWSIYLRPYR